MLQRDREGYEPLAPGDLFSAIDPHQAGSLMARMELVSIKFLPSDQRELTREDAIEQQSAWLCAAASSKACLATNQPSGSDPTRSSVTWQRIQTQKTMLIAIVAE